MKNFILGKPSKDLQSFFLAWRRQTTDDTRILWIQAKTKSTFMNKWSRHHLNTHRIWNSTKSWVFNNENQVKPLDVGIPGCHENKGQVQSNIIYCFLSFLFRFRNIFWAGFPWWIPRNIFPNTLMSCWIDFFEECIEWRGFVFDDFWYSWKSVE